MWMHDYTTTMNAPREIHALAYNTTYLFSVMNSYVNTALIYHPSNFVHEVLKYSYVYNPFRSKWLKAFILEKKKSTTRTKITDVNNSQNDVLKVETSVRKWLIFFVYLRAAFWSDLFVVFIGDLWSPLRWNVNLCIFVCVVMVKCFYKTLKVLEISSTSTWTWFIWKLTGKKISCRANVFFRY